MILVENAPVVAVLGPTASGKSALALELALALNGEIIGCDAMQIYRRMDIGTAKPTLAERARVAHHMIDIAEPGVKYSAARYAREALMCIHEVRERGKTPVVAGGTGFYWRTLHRGGSPAPPGDALVRARLNALDEQTLLARLRQADPVSAARLPVGDKRRVVRALEVFELSGKPLSSFPAHGAPRFPAVVLGLRFDDRQTLYSRVNDRVDAMLAAGLLQEVEALLREGFGETAAQAIGYKEFVPFLQNQCSLNEAVALCKQNTRRYAKRQLTWFAREPGVVWLNAAAPDWRAAIKNAVPGWNGV